MTLPKKLEPASPDAEAGDVADSEDVRRFVANSIFVHPFCPEFVLVLTENRPVFSHAWYKFHVQALFICIVLL